MYCNNVYYYQRFLPGCIINAFTFIIRVDSDK